MDCVEAVLTNNAMRIGDEYMFEACVKVSRNGSLNQSIMVDDVAVTRDTLFLASDVTYGSWSLLYELRRAANHFKLEPALGKGSHSATWTYLVALFRLYDANVSDRTTTGLARLLTKAQRVADLFIKALYGHNKTKDVYTASPDGPVAKAYVQADKKSSEIQGGVAGRCYDERIL